MLVSDDFTGGNGGLEGNWTTVPGTSAPQVSDGVAVPGAPGRLNSAYWSADSFSDDQFAQATLPGSSGWAFGPGIAVRLSGATGYLLWYGNSPGTVSLWRMDSASSWSELAQSGALTVSASDVWRIAAVGSTITGYQNGNLVVQATDSAYGSGSPGIWLYYAGNQVAGWSGGDVTGGGSGAGATYSVGGTVSGLTGPVSLRDNGGDDVTVSADGAFTFPTSLASGTPYAVTVQAEPPGQTCAVTDGAGTVGSANVTSVAVTCATDFAVSASDDFSRADGALGRDWTDMSDGGLVITSCVAAGTRATGVSGDIRTAESYPSDQYSQIQLTAAQLTGGQWAGPAVRMQADDRSGYVAAYSWNNGAPEVVLYERAGSELTQLAPAYQSGPLPAGTTLSVEAVGATLAVLVNGTEQIAAADGTYVGGSPGIMAYGSAQVADWTGGTAGFSVDYLSTDADGVKSYDVISGNDGPGPQSLRVLEPTDPAPGVAHNFLFVLPVEAGTGSTFGDGIATIESANLQNQYNLTVIEPSFAIQPWYANNPLNPSQQEETFMADELAPWVKANLATTGTEQNWLIGFSKSGIGGQDLILKHPDVFALAASWDAPFKMSSYNEIGGDPADSYGTNANFQANYQLTPAFLQAHQAPFAGSNRIWVGGYASFQADDSEYDAQLTSAGIEHTTETWTYMAHRWDSGWVPIALAALYQDSLNLGRS
ncbi:MAG TPA: alpha/beta hydrolase-fold protein [Trebonia sp.]|nr:alpha/beta hydrolase-fold protein [Trebonia sp.]